MGDRHDERQPDGLDRAVRAGRAAAPSAKSAITDALRRDIVVRDPGLPAPSALYNPALEKDACGVGFVADMKNRKSHAIVTKGLDILRNLVAPRRGRRGPEGGRRLRHARADPAPLLHRRKREARLRAPRARLYAVGQFFLPRDPDVAQVCRDIIEKAIADEGFRLLGFRVPPTDNADLGVSVKPTEPRHLQVFVGRDSQSTDEDTFERASSSCAR